MTGIGRCVCVQISQISESQSFCVGVVFFQIYQLSCLRVTPYSLYLDSVRRVNNQRVIHRSTQCFIDGQENKNGNLTIGFEQYLELFYSKSVDKGMVFFCCVV